MLDLVLSNRVVGKVKFKVNLGYGDREMMELKSLRSGRRVHSRVWPGLEGNRLWSLQGAAPWSAVG